MANATYNGVGIGDHAWLEVSTSNEIEVHKIPRADGTILRRRGGSLKTLIVHAFIIKTGGGELRKDIELFFDQLGGAFGSDFSDLIINGETYSNCLLQNIAADSVHNRWARFTVTFLKSGD